MLDALPKYLHTRTAFAALFDHTALKPETTPAQIKTLCAEAREFGFKGVCVNPCYVNLAARELAGSPQLTMAVVGFPLGATTPDVKQFEARRAIFDGASEIDMDINVGALKSGDRKSTRLNSSH